MLADTNVFEQMVVAEPEELEYAAALTESVKRLEHCGGSVFDQYMQQVAERTAVEFDRLVKGEWQQVDFDEFSPEETEKRIRDWQYSRVSFSAVSAACCTPSRNPAWTGY